MALRVRWRLSRRGSAGFAFLALNLVGHRLAFVILQRRNFHQRAFGISAMDGLAVVPQRLRAITQCEVDSAFATGRERRSWTKIAFFARQRR